MASKRKNAASRTAVWVILGLLIVGLAGFGATNFGGSVRSIGTVGDTDIGVNRYARELTQELQALSTQTGQQIGLAEAEQLGLDRAVLQRIVSIVALENEASELGLSVGDAEIRDQVLNISAFQGLDGTFDREAYRFALERSGLSEAAFEDSLRAEVARTMLQAAVADGVPAPDAYTDTVLGYLAERRSFEYLRLGPEALETPVGDPEDAMLRAHYDANPDNYRVPEARRITYAWLTPEMLAAAVDADDEALRALYEARSDEFNSPERRLVERLVFGSAELAAVAKAQLDAGEKTFEDLVAERGLELSDVDLGDVTEAELGAAGPPVFAAAEPGIVGPVGTELGPAVFRMNAILSAQVTSFEDARDELMDDYTLDRARRAIGDQIDAFDDLLAGGATLEDLAAETEMQIGRIDWTPDLGDGIAAYDDFRDAALEAELGDFPELRELDDGGVFALRLDEVVEPRLQPFDAVRDEVEEDWRAAEAQRGLAASAAEIAGQIGNGAEMSSFGDVRTESGVTREAFVPDVPAVLLREVFLMDEGEVRSVEGEAAAYVVRLTDIAPPETDNPDVAQRRQALGAFASEGIGQDLLQAFVFAVETEAGIRLNQAAISAVHTQMR